MSTNWKSNNLLGDRIEDMNIEFSSRREAVVPQGSLSGTKRLHESDTFGLDKEIVKKFLQKKISYKKNL